MTQTSIAILVLLAIIAVIAILAIKGKKEIIYKIIFALVDEAEAAFGSKTGKLKFAYVVERIYTILPAFVRVFITYNMLEKLIEKALAEAKEYWAERADITEEAPTVSGFAQNN
jgi:hypothetical protein